MPNFVRPWTEEAAVEERVGDKIKRLEQRIRELEAILKCTGCGHLRSEHDDDDAPCFGGRTPEMKPGEGEYCDCSGFTLRAPVDGGRGK